MAPRQRIHGDISRFEEHMEPVYEDLASEIRIELGKGRAPAVAVNNGMKSARVDQNIRIAMMDGVVSAAAITAHEEAFRRYYWQKDFGTGINLSEQLWQLSGDMRMVMTQEIRHQIAQSRTWQQVSKAIADTDLATPKLARVIDDLARTAKMAFAGDPNAAVDYTKQIRKAQRHVDRLAANGAPTKRLKKAYQRVINATAKGSAGAVDKAIDSAVVAKGRYNADRVARTEIAKAYEEGLLTKFSADDDQVATRSELSSRHPRPDICDFHAKANMYGLGAGVYPKDNGPPYPYHPSCTCILTPVYRTKGDPGTATPDNKAGAKWLNDHPNLRRSMLTKQGEKAFQKNKKSWPEHVQNFQGYEQKKAQIPKRYYD